ncbi:hypothetical protein ACGFXC_02180 [Streptomyces sp. NPDC048507]|uniref:hypothetical protein n=1 Tax=Streptomyces sp. NPDC048507 TaxID=3365560 RepID=UPI0037133170
MTDLGRDFDTMISQLRPAPCIQSATIDPSPSLPVVDNVSFESLQADGGGIVTCINVAYSRSLLEFGITHPDVRVSSMLIIDSPRTASGSNLDDQARGHRTYQRFQTLAEVHGSKAQLIIADNDSAPIPGSVFSKIELDYGNPLVPGVVHPGPEHTRRAEDES